MENNEPASDSFSSVISKRKQNKYIDDSFVVVLSQKIFLQLIAVF